MSGTEGPSRQALRVLFVEDSPADAELFQRALTSDGFAVEHTVVSSPEDLTAAISAASYDVILSDYNLGHWHGDEALRIVKAANQNVPFILVTGSLGDERAVEIIKAGAADYVLKDHVARLPFAVRRALKDRELREESQRLGEQLRQSQKLEAIGMLSGGIAHDFNNILNVIMGYSELLMDEAPNERVRTRLGQIKHAAERAASLTHQLLAFSRKQVLEPVTFSLNSALRDMERLLRRLIGENVKLVSQMTPDLGMVRVDASQMEQVILNLAVNARDAMPHGGTLTLETANVELDENYCRSHVGMKPGPHVMLAVSDTGVGMDAATRARIFDPFFTTKEKGKGTGLGLATVYGIVKQSGGSIWVYSEPGKGTTFKIYFRRVHGAADVAAPAAAVQRRPTAPATILVIEDDLALREFACECLSKLGHTVLAAENGKEAVRLAEEHAGPIQLVVTDVILPGITGTQAVELIRALRPAIKTLYVSGYTENTIVHQGVLDPGIHFLQKPYRPADLERKVSELLDESAAGAAGAD